jgi:hypothetical protein
MVGALAVFMCFYVSETLIRLLRGHISPLSLSMDYARRLGVLDLWKLGPFYMNRADWRSKFSPAKV